MSWRHDQHILEEKEEVIAKVKEALGYEPTNLLGILKALSHPQVIQDTLRYLNLVDVENRCQKYEAPWNCAREAEAKYENIKYGWLGAGYGIGFAEWWCDPCKSKVLRG